MPIGGIYDAHVCVKVARNEEEEEAVRWENEKRNLVYKRKLQRVSV